MAVTLTPLDRLKVGVIGVGGEGCRLVNQLKLNPEWEVTLGLWDSCRNSLDRLDAASGTTQILGVNLAHGLGCVGQSDLGRSIYLEEQDFCRKWLEDKDLVIVSGALGGGFAGGFLPEFAKLAKQMNTMLIAYVMLPFSFEGRKRMESSRQILAKLREYCNVVPTIEGDDFLEDMDESGFAQPAVDRMAYEGIRAISGMLLLLQEKGLYEFNLSTLRSVFDLDVSKTLLIGGDGPHAVESVEQTIELVLERINQKLPEKDLKVDRLLISVVGGSQLAAGSINQINRLISERFSQSGKTFFAASVSDVVEGVQVTVYASVHLGKQFEWVALSSEDARKQAVHKESRKAAGKKAGKRKKHKKTDDDEEVPQGLFDAILNESNRGYFDETPANSWNGIDLDVPTYIRRGIRVKI